jgi:hypothetical protein
MFLCFSSFDLDSFFDFFDETQQSGIMFPLLLWVNQLMAVSKLDSFARITESICLPLQLLAMLLWYTETVERQLKT